MDDLFLGAEARLLADAQQVLSKLSEYDLGMMDRVAHTEVFTRVARWLERLPALLTEEKTLRLKQQVYSFFPDLDLSVLSEDDLSDVRDMAHAGAPFAVDIPGTDWAVYDFYDERDRITATRNWLLKEGVTFRTCPICGGDISTEDDRSGTLYAGICGAPECPLHGVHPEFPSSIPYGARLQNAAPYTASFIARGFPRCQLTAELVLPTPGYVLDTWFWHRPFHVDLVIINTESPFRHIVRLDPQQITPVGE